MQKFKQIFCGLFSIIVLFASIFSTLIHPIVLDRVSQNLCTKITTAANFPKFSEFIKTLFGKNETQVKDREPVYVYLGGQPLGFTINCSGVVVIAISNKQAGDLQAGDILTKIEGVEINSTETINKVINIPEFAGKELVVDYLRGENFGQTKINPIYDDLKKCYKLGLWVRDNSAGIGTLTYIRKDNLRFGALGHPVCDIDTGAVLPVLDGKILKCNIVGLKKGLKGNPGELKGLFLRNASTLGTLEENNKFGVFGTFNEKQIEKYKSQEYEVAYRSEVKSGKAKIRCTIDGCEPKEYDIEIVKTYFQQSKDNKSMFIRVTDKELLEKTGGIVQGMSGSPIIQNGKFVGAVTHVFVSDPTKGYGVYADWMIGN